jgi:hypothetical protein
MSLPILPETLEIVVNGKPNILTGKPNKDQTRIYFSGKRVVAQQTTAPDKALAKVTVSYNGEALRRSGDVHITEPQKYRAGHPKAGQNKPNTGGNWSVTHTAQIVLNDLRTGTPHRFTLNVTVTYVVGEGFVVNGSALQPTRSAVPMLGEEPSFVDA